MVNRIHCFLFLYLGFCGVFFHTINSDFCGRKPRPPPIGCCLPEFNNVCCSNVKPCENNRTENARHLGKPECIYPWNTTACEAGFYKGMNGNVFPCPDGFYCPRLSTCIIPCPIGAICIQAKLTNVEMDYTKLFGQFGKYCLDANKFLTAPLTTKNGILVCAGSGQPGTCPQGYYCPNSTIKVLCPENSFCREGSLQPQPCPVLVKCSTGESSPLKNVTFVLFAVVSMCLLLILNEAYQRRRSVKNFFCSCCFCCWRTRCEKKVSTNKDCKTVFLSLTSPVERNQNISVKDYKMDVTFENLSLHLKTKRRKKTLLSEVCGHFQSCRVTAIMGPSGSGKTTLINALAGRASYGVLTGEIKINGKVVPDLAKYKSIMGFVPQDDIMHCVLTVKEVLTYQARLRLPESISEQDITAKVKQVLELLGIPDISLSLIGDAKNRGISGGQRKRVNIGMELVADPTILFLDEPTSGLDSYSSLCVVRALRSLAVKGNMTIVCVIHQPRYEIFKMLHSVLFLNREGKMVFQGSGCDAERYFGSLGFIVPPKVNPADFCIDVISGISWSRHLEPFNNIANSCKIQDTESKLGTEKGKDFSEKRKTPGFFKQCWIFMNREIVIHFRNIKTIFIDILLTFIAGAALGGLYIEVSLWKIIVMTAMNSLAIGLSCITFSLRAFGSHGIHFWRESSSGINRFSYFIAVNLTQIPFLLILPLVFLCFQYTLANPRASFLIHYCASSMVYFAVSGIGYFVSCVFNARNAQIAAVLVVLIFALLAGSNTTLCTFNDFSLIGPGAYSMSFARWYVEAIFEKEAAEITPILRPKVDYFQFGNNYTLDKYNFCLFVLFIIGVVYRALSFICLVIATRRGQLAI